MTEFCPGHSGIERELTSLKDNDKRLWEAVDTVRDKQEGIIGRLNTILGGMVVAIFVLLLNVVLSLFGKGH